MVIFNSKNELGKRCDSCVCGLRADKHGNLLITAYGAGMREAFAFRIVQSELAEWADRCPLDAVLQGRVEYP